MEKIEYVNHDDVEMLNKYDFIEIYLKLLPQCYSLYKEKLLGKRFEYSFSSQHNNILFSFDEQCCMHLLGLDFNKTKELFVEYYDLFNLDLQDDFSKLCNKTSNEMLEIVIDNIDKIMEYVQYAQNVNINNCSTVAINTRVINFVNKLRKCLSDFSFEKMEAIDFFSNNMTYDYFKEFAIINPSWQNVDCSICFNYEDNIFSLGLVSGKYGTYSVSSIRRDDISKFSLETINCDSKVSLIKFCSCHKNATSIPVYKKYDSSEYIFSCIEFINELNKDISFDFDVVSFFKTFVKKNDNLARENRCLTASISSLKRENFHLVGSISSLERKNFHLVGSNGFLERENCRLTESNRFLKSYIDGAFSSDDNCESIYRALSFHLKSIYGVYFSYTDFVDFLSSGLDIKYEFICDYINENNLKKIEKKYGKSCDELKSSFDDFIQCLVKYIRKKTATYKQRDYKQLEITSKLLDLVLPCILKNSSNKRIINNEIPDYSTHDIRCALGTIRPAYLSILRRKYALQEKGIATNSITCALSSLNTILKKYDRMFDNLDNEKFMSIIDNLNDERAKLIMNLKYGFYDSKEYSLHEINECLMENGFKPTTSIEIAEIFNFVFVEYMSKKENKSKKKQL